MDHKESLVYWIRERYNILLRKERGEGKPWSTDPVFQSTYFCNVHRENDKVTRFIRDMYSPMVADEMFEYNIILSRFINLPKSLESLSYCDSHQPNELQQVLEEWASAGFQVWGGAYVITTHGMKMGKAEYLAHNVLEDVFSALESLRTACRGRSCAVAAKALQEIDGIGSFLAGQVVADLKNTVGHPLHTADDWWSFVVPGPGSLRGLSWFIFGRPDGPVTPGTFKDYFEVMRSYVDRNWPVEVPTICNQDLQNCLCEYDKYMRVKTGTGRSKRKYNGC